MRATTRSLVCSSLLFLSIALTGCVRERSSGSGGESSSTTGGAGAGGGTGGAYSVGSSGAGGAGGAGDHACPTCGIDEACNPTTHHCDPACAGLQSGAPWPMVGRCAARRAVSPFVGAQTSHVKWSLTIPNTYASPEVTIDAGGTIYVPTSAGLTAVLSTGSVKWTAAAGAGCFPPLIGEDGTLYVVSCIGPGLRALDPADGSVKWTSASLGSSANQPALRSDGDFVGYNGSVVELGSPDGQTLWETSLGKSVAMINSPAVAPDGTVYVAASDHAHFDAVAADGSIAWSYPVLTPGAASTATIGPDGTIYGMSNTNIFALTPAGVPLWDVSITTDQGLFSWLGVGPDGTVYAVNDLVDGAAIYAVAPADGSLKWAFNTSTMSASAPAIGADGTVYVSLGPIVHAFRPNGSSLWSFIAMGTACGTPAIGADGTIYAVCAGVLEAFGP